MDFWDKNIEVLKERFPYIVELIESGASTEQEVFWDEDLDGNAILAVQKEGYLWYLNSRYHAGELVEAWCERHKRKRYFEPELIFGMGTGDYLIRLREENPQNPFLVWEPDLQVFLALLHKRDMSEVFRDEKLYLAVGREELAQINAWMGYVINYSNYEYIDFCALPGYTSIYPYEYLLYKRAFMELLETMIINRNTFIYLGQNAVQNEFSNIGDILNQCSAQDLVAGFREKQDEMPGTAFLVAAGPSLDKNMQDLKLIQGRAFIMAVDTSIRPLLQAGIQPDMFITIDPKKDSFLFEQEGVAKIPLILGSDVQRTVVKTHTGKHFYTFGDNNYIVKYAKKYNKAIMSGSAGGSVATIAFHMLKRMGFSTIVLVGQDFAYPNNRSHAKAAYDDEVKPTDDGRYFMIEDIHGEQVLTRLDMNSYRRWMENEIESAKNLRVIDATEGGARIRGTEIMTLKDAIARECHETYDFASVIQSIEPTFTKEECEEIREDLKKFPEYLKDTIRKLEEGRRAYERLDKLNRKRKYQTSEFRHAYEEITEFNKWLSKDSIVELLSYLAQKQEITIQMNSYSVKEDIYEDIREIASHGIAMIDAYMEKKDILEESAKLMAETE